MSYTLNLFWIVPTLLTMVRAFGTCGSLHENKQPEQRSAAKAAEWRHLIQQHISDDALVWRVLRLKRYKMERWNRGAALQNGTVEQEGGKPAPSG
jgi:hypothetical protein